MKKVLSFIAILLLVVGLCACEKTHTLTISINGQDHSVTVQDGQTLENYNFDIDEIAFEIDGWYCNGQKYDLATPITKDIKISCTLIDKEYTIVFKNDEGKPIKTTKYYAYEDIEAPKNPTKSSDNDYDYTFTGWDKEFTSATMDMEIIATFSKSPVTYTLTIMNVDGTQYSKTQVQKGTKLELPTATKDDTTNVSFTFSHWAYSDGTKYDEKVGLSYTNKYPTLVPVFTKKPKSASTEGLVVSMIGDSISTFYKEGDTMVSYYSGNDEFYYPKYGPEITSGSMTWWGQLITKLGAKLGINNSLSGSNCIGSGCTDGRINTLNKNGEPDIVITLLGGNDNVNGYSKEQYYEAYDQMLTKIEKKYPNAFIFCITNGYSAYTGYNYTEAKRIELNDATRQVVQKHGATLIDWSTKQTTATYQTYLRDSLHLSKTGMNELANYTYSIISQFYVDKSK